METGRRCETPQPPHGRTFSRTLNKEMLQLVDRYRLLPREYYIRGGQTCYWLTKDRLSQPELLGESPFPFCLLLYSTLVIDCHFGRASPFLSWEFVSCIDLIDDSIENSSGQIYQRLYTVCPPRSIEVMETRCSVPLDCCCSRHPSDLRIAANQDNSLWGKVLGKRQVLPSRLPNEWAYTWAQLAQN